MKINFEHFASVGITNMYSCLCSHLYKYSVQHQLKQNIDNNNKTQKKEEKNCVDYKTYIYNVDNDNSFINKNNCDNDNNTINSELNFVAFCCFLWDSSLHRFFFFTQSSRMDLNYYNEYIRKMKQNRCNTLTLFTMY